MSNPPLIVFLDAANVGGALTRRPAAPHIWVDHQRTAPHQALERLQGATIAVLNKTPLDGETLRALPDLRLIVVTATGTDIIDKVTAAELGIPVLNVAGYGSVSVAEHVLMLLLALVRGLLPHRAAVLDGSWCDSGQFCVFAAPVRELSTLRLGLVGSGAIAQEVAKRARALGVEVVFAARRGAAPGEGKLAFEEVLRTADVLSLHCPLTEDTRHLIDAETLALMKPDAFLINTARGALIDEAALLEALDEGRIGGAGLDVAPVEPPAPDAPIVELARRPNVIVTPHVAWTGKVAMRTLADSVIDQIDAFLK
jgi:glycerate dehydrogenase